VDSVERLYEVQMDLFLVSRGKKIEFYAPIARDHFKIYHKVAKISN
jgi:hypothetical protein